jgi:hypothetical protein
MSAADRTFGRMFSADWVSGMEKVIVKILDAAPDCVASSDLHATPPLPSRVVQFIAQQWRAKRRRRLVPRGMPRAESGPEDCMDGIRCGTGFMQASMPTSSIS